MIAVRAQLPACSAPRRLWIAHAWRFGGYGEVAELSHVPRNCASVKNNQRATMDGCLPLPAHGGPLWLLLPLRSQAASSSECSRE